MVRGDSRGERRRESRLILALPLSRITEVVCANYEIERTELGRRRNRHPARPALAYLARRRTAATNAELAAVLGVSRTESVPNLTRRFAAWLETEPRIRAQLRALEKELDKSRPSELNCK